MNKIKKSTLITIISLLVTIIVTVQLNKIDQFIGTMFLLCSLAVDLLIVYNIRLRKTLHKASSNIDKLIETLQQNYKGDK